MPCIEIEHSSGEYSIRELTEEQADAGVQQGLDFAHVEGRVLEAWRRHCDEHAAFNALWRALDNELHTKLRARELLPLEHANRQIEQLKAELERAKHTAKFFEEEWSALSALHRKKL